MTRGLAESTRSRPIPSCRKTPTRQHDRVLRQTMHAQRRLKLRSRTGCARCRTRHQKCDERRPGCGRCREAASACVYQEQQKPQAPSLPCKDTPTQQLTLPSRSISGVYTGVVPLHNATHVLFLDYFIRDASSAICCHESIRQDTCQAVVSVGCTFPGLLYACLLFGALHASSRKHASSKLDVQILELRATALSLLREQLHADDQSNYAAVIATALMLATGELRYDAEASSWRKHFDCARQLLADAVQNGQEKAGNGALWRFIHRRFALLEFLVSLPSSARRVSGSACPQQLPTVQANGVIDAGLACCQDLLQVFTWIGALEDISNAPGNDVTVPHVADMASELVQIVRLMMARDQERPPTLNDLEAFCDDDQRHAYQISNAIAQHLALIFLYRYSRDTAGIGVSVGSIIRLAFEMPKHNGLHPYIGLTTALFVAGCEAGPEDQSDIITLLQAQYDITRNRNAQRALAKLQVMWYTEPRHAPRLSSGRTTPCTSIRD